MSKTRKLSGLVSDSGPLADGLLSAADIGALALAGGTLTGTITFAGAQTFPGTQAALVSGTNIKTINGNSVLGSGDLEVSGGLEYVTKTTNYTAADKQGVLADTFGGAFTVALPAAPVTGAQVVVADAGSSWGTNNLTVDGNGSTIGGLAENLICDITGASVQFVYDGTTWEVYAQIGGQGGNAVTLDGTQTLVNKTLTSPVINGFTGSTGIINIGAGQVYKDASGNVGIGTSSPIFKLSVASSTNNDGVQIFNTSTANSTGKTTRVGFYGTDTVGTVKETGSVYIVPIEANYVDSAMLFFTRGSDAVGERMRLTSTGNVGIGTSSPGAKLDVKIAQLGSTAGNSVLAARLDGDANGNSDFLDMVQIRTSTGAGWSNAEWRIRRNVDSTAAQGAIGFGGDNTVLMYTNGSERARIDSSGNLLVGPSGGPVFQTAGIAGSHKKGAWTQHDTAQPYGYVDYMYGTFRSGYILWNNGGLSLNSLSDVRMKKNIQDATSSLLILNSLQVRQFDWKSTDKHENFGFIAQELKEIFPEAVGVMEDETLMCGVDNTKLVPLLVKGLQEQQAMIEQLKADVAALKGA
jgi:hypothetical protein